MAYRDKSFCNMTECRNTECDRRISEADIEKAKKLGLMIAYSEFWRNCITYEQAKEIMK